MHILLSSFASMFLFNITVFYIVLFMLHFLACPYIFFELHYLHLHYSICCTTHMIYCQYLLLISESVCIYWLLNLMSMWLSCKDLLYGLTWSDNKLWFWNINLPPTEWCEEKLWHTSHCYHCQLWMMNIFIFKEETQNAEIIQIQYHF